MKNREYLISLLKKIGINEYADNSAKANNAVANIYNKHALDMPLMLKHLLHNTINHADDFELYALTEEIANSHLKDFFTPEEIKVYSKMKREKEVVEFPIIIKPAIKISEDQYIFSGNAKWLFNLREHQLLNYNVATQRATTHVVKKGEDIWQITVYEEAVKKIKESMEQGHYVPTTITLNIPEFDRENEEPNDFYYDEKNLSLVINRIDAFDILDGYHRYLALCRAVDNNPDFDYPMEVRIVHFPEYKAKSFIYQEDQKTKMRKIDSNSMDMYKDANYVTDRLNASITFDLQDEISRSSGLISFGEFAEIVDYLYFKKNKSQITAKERILIQKALEEGFNGLTYYDTDYLEHKYSFTDLCIILYGIKNGKSSEEIDKAVQNQNKLDVKKFYNKKARQPLFTEINNKLYS